jgi:hypothetical protein
MNIHFIELIRFLSSFAVGSGIGCAFGILQDRAIRQNEKRQVSGDLKSGLKVMPGSMGRVAYLLVALVLVQIVCPLFFEGDSQWWVSGGVVVGYGWILYRRLSRRRASLP